VIRTIIGFSTIAVAILVALHFYAWRRLVRDVRLPKTWHRIATVVVVLLALALPAVFVFGRRFAPIRETEAAYFSYLWLGVLFYLFLLLGAIDLVRLVALRGRARKETFDPERRLFLARAAAGTAVLGSGTIAALGYRAAGEIETPELEIPLPNLPRELSGFRIAHLSDLHLGPISRERFLETVVEKTNAMKPDLVVITGDLVDASVARLGKSLAPLAKLSPRSGIAFVTGNHEYYSGADEWVAFLRAHGIRVLMNERFEVGDGHVGGATFDLAGIPDHGGGHFREDHKPDVELALEGRDPERAVVLLAHQPRQIALARGRGVGLQLSGHTHGGQLWPFGALVSLYQPWIAGLHTADDGTRIYVSRGTGFWGPPMRVGNPAEIASIVLTPA
jgi:predicted MPP superfamily phosphohydrolase